MEIYWFKVDVVVPTIPSLLLSWKKARGLYTNDISCFYKMISRFTYLKKHDLDMFTYLGQVQAVMEEYNKLYPLLKCWIFGAPPEDVFSCYTCWTKIWFESVRDQILVRLSNQRRKYIKERLRRLRYEKMSQFQQEKSRNFILVEGWNHVFSVSWLNLRELSDWNLVSGKDICNRCSI